MIDAINPLDAVYETQNALFKLENIKKKLVFTLISDNLKLKFTCCVDVFVSLPAAKWFPKWNKKSADLIFHAPF